VINLDNCFNKFVLDDDIVIFLFINILNLLINN